MGNRHGFAIEEILITVLAVCICVPLVTYAVSITTRQLQMQNDMQDGIALVQLRRYLSVAYDMQITDDALYFHYQEKEMVLHVVNQNLIIQPGTQIFLQDVQDIKFYEESGDVIMEYIRKDERYEVFLYKT